MLLSLLAHHSEAADPELIEWIKHQDRRDFRPRPATIVIVLDSLSWRCRWPS